MKRLPDKRTPRSTKSWFTLGIAVGATALLAGAWAATEVFSPPPTTPKSSAHVYARAVTGAVESAVPLRVAAEWHVKIVVPNQADGTVTSVEISGSDPVSPGAVLYTVNLRPTVAAQGEIPSFRRLTSGDHGEDVKQLQSFLSATGYYLGVSDGAFGPNTVVAVKRWQESLGVDKTGDVEVGDIAYIPEMPARIIINSEEMRPGAVITGGNDAIRVLAYEPSFSASVTGAQAGALEIGTSVIIARPATEWLSQVATMQPNEDGSVAVGLTTQDGRPVCAEQCAELPTGVVSQMPARAITVPETTGTRIPSAAIKTTAKYSQAVILRTGRVVPVTVVASARGESIVTGIGVGDEVRIGPN